MSGWNGYITNMTSQGACHAAVVTKAGQLCAATEGFTVSVSELQTLKACIDGHYNGDTKVEVNGQPCTMIQFSTEEGFVQVKTKNAIEGDSKVLYHIEASNHYYSVCGMCGPKERDAMKYCRGITDYLKSLGD